MMFTFGPRTRATQADEFPADVQTVRYAWGTVMLINAATTHCTLDAVVAQSEDCTLVS
jgi:hypothetical protein